MSVCCECCVLSGRGLCVGLITRSEESYRLWCVWVRSWSLDNEKALAHWWLLRQNKRKLLLINFSCWTSINWKLLTPCILAVSSHFSLILHLFKERNSLNNTEFFSLSSVISNQSTRYSMSWCAGCLSWWGPLQQGDLCRGFSQILIDVWLLVSEGSTLNLILLTTQTMVITGILTPQGKFPW